MCLVVPCESSVGWVLVMFMLVVVYVVGAGVGEPENGRIPTSFQRSPSFRGEV